MDRHKIRHCVGIESEPLSDKELDEIMNIINYQSLISDDSIYEYASSFIFTTSLEERDKKIDNMCCGIMYDDIKLQNGKTIYYAFDYGH
ncbi:MAG: hypothetical protein ACOC2W_02915 [bacterium]